MKTIESRRWSAKRLAAASVCTVAALTVAACGGTTSMSTESGDTIRQAAGDKYPRIVITVDKGEVYFRLNPDYERKSQIRAKQVLKTHQVDGKQVFSLPDRSQGIKTVNGHDWYKKNGENQYEVTVYGKDIEKRNGRIHLEAASGHLMGKSFDEIVTGGFGYRNELIVEPIVDQGKVTAFKVQTTDKAKVGRGEHRFYNVSLDATISTATNDWQKVTASTYKNRSKSSIVSSESNPAIARDQYDRWFFLPVLEARTETRDDGSQALVFREKWNETNVLNISD